MRNDVFRFSIIIGIVIGLIIRPMGPTAEGIGVQSGEKPGAKYRRAGLINLK